MEDPPLKRQKKDADLAVVAPQTTLKTFQSARRPPNKPKHSNAQSVRLRPLHVNDKIQNSGQGRDPKWDELDGGAFDQWLQNRDNTAQAEKESESSVKPQVLVVAHSSMALSGDDISQEIGKAAPLPTDAVEDPIDLLRCRQLSYSQRSIDGGLSRSEGGVEGPYVHYVSPDGDGVESRVEYDMDDEDQEWLARFNAQTGSRGPGALSKDMYEMLIDHFEKALHSLLQRQIDLWPAGVDPALEPPIVSGMYSLERACESEDLAHISQASIEAVYKRWCKKREKANQPLLQRLWSEQPWVRARDAGKEAPPGVHKSSDSDLPFLGQHAPRPPTTHTMNTEEAIFKLKSIRTELETIRTTADQVRRPERGKKRELLQVREERCSRARLAADGTDPEAGHSEPGASVAVPAELPPDREAHLATQAASKVAREAATLITAQVMLDPSNPDDRVPSAETGTSHAAASRQAEKEELLHKPEMEESVHLPDNLDGLMTALDSMHVCNMIALQNQGGQGFSDSSAVCQFFGEFMRPSMQYAMDDLASAQSAAVQTAPSKETEWLLENNPFYGANGAQRDDVSAAITIFVRNAVGALLSKQFDDIFLTMDPIVSLWDADPDLTTFAKPTFMRAAWRRGLPRKGSKVILLLALCPKHNTTAHNRDEADNCMSVQNVKALADNLDCPIVTSNMNMYCLRYFDKDGRCHCMPYYKVKEGHVNVMSVTEHLRALQWLFMSICFDIQATVIAGTEPQKLYCKRVHSGVGIIRDEYIQLREMCQHAEVPCMMHPVHFGTKRYLDDTMTAFCRLWCQLHPDSPAEGWEQAFVEAYKSFRIAR